MKSLSSRRLAGLAPLLLATACAAPRASGGLGPGDAEEIYYEAAAGLLAGHPVTGPKDRAPRPLCLAIRQGDGAPRDPGERLLRRLRVRFPRVVPESACPPDSLDAVRNGTAPDHLVITAPQPRDSRFVVFHFGFEPGFGGSCSAERAEGRWRVVCLYA